MATRDATADAQQNEVANADALVTVRRLTRRFGERTAVDGVSFAIGRGEIFGLLGPNGAGKSTMVNMLSTYLPPDGGEATIAGHSLREGMTVKHLIGVVPQELALFAKQDLLWTAPHLRTPQQMETWTDVVAMVHNEVGLARPLAEARRLPWEGVTRSPTPRQVRRDLARIIGQVGTPARPPRPRGKSPGRAPGAVMRPALRHPVIRKSPARRRKRRRTA